MSAMLRRNPYPVERVIAIAARSVTFMAGPHHEAHLMFTNDYARISFALREFPTPVQAEREAHLSEWVNIDDGRVSGLYRDLGGTQELARER